jgi:DNA-binding Lrp family transcriptional regulator
VTGDDVLKLHVPLEEIDIKILTTLEQGYKISTSKLSEMLGVPDRTIRYRLTRLKEKGFLFPAKVQTHERKLGLGEYVLLVRSTIGSEQALTRIFDEIPSIYLYTPTYGRYEGFVVYVNYPLTNPTLAPDFAEMLKKEGFIAEYYLIDLVDYQRRGAQISRLLSDEPKWTWMDWYKDIATTMSNGDELSLEMEEFPQVVSIDYIDVKMLAKKVKKPKITLRELGDILELSQAQVHNRMKKLEKSGIIRGYKPSIRPFLNPMKFGIFLKSDENALKILQAFSKLPYFFWIGMESKSHFYILIDLPSSEMNGFLEGYRMLRAHAEVMFMQFMGRGTNKGYEQIMDSFDLESQTWKYPVDEYPEIVKKHASKRGK